MKIKNHFKSIILLSLLGLTVVSFSSCDKDDDPVVTNTITDIVVANSSYSVLKEAVVKAGLDATLRGAGPFTVFAPDNAAFSAAGITSSTVASLSSTQLSDLLLYHTIGSKILAVGVPVGPNAKVITAGGDSIFVTNKGAGGVFINGIAVAQADIAADNGVIHRLAKSLNKPSGNIVATAQASGLDSLVKAVLRVNNTAGGNPNIVSLLSNNTLTVFAPTNAAFTQVLSALSLTDINQIPIGTLTAVLGYHVVGGRAFSSDLANGSVTMFASGSTTVNLTNGTGGGPTITGTGNGANRSNITATNIMCRNGVVHLIDRVLLP